MSSGYLVSPEAARDLEEIWWYVFQFANSDERADAVIERLMASCERIASHPHVGTTRAWAPDSRFFASGRYLIVYRLVDGTPVIQRVSGADEDVRDLGG